jgi:hypothetical protein
MDYNPYDLILVTVNSTTDLYARPVEFDSEVVNTDEMTNSDGQLVMPSKIETVCPDCGSTISIEVKLSGPPFGVIDCVCNECNPAPVPLADPFINPVETGRIKPSDLDPAVINPAEKVDENPSTTVADRIKTVTKKAKKAKKAPKKASATKKPKKSSKPEKIKKKTKKSSEEPSEAPASSFKVGKLGTKAADLSPDMTSNDRNQRLVPLEPAQDMDKESDFNDDDLVD